MDKYSTSDADAALGNRQYQVREMALRLMRQDSWLTLKEATDKASSLYSRGERIRPEDLR